jgi:lipopolysaccharide transport protein LptA
MFFVGLCFFTGQVSYAVNHKDNSASPIQIVSDSAKYNTLDNKAFFEGNVIITHDGIKLLCDKVEVIFGKVPNSEIGTIDNSARIEKLIFLGNVSIISPQETANSEEGEYDVFTKKFILRKNVSLKQGSDVLYGDELIYSENTGETLLTWDKKNKERVRGVFTPKEKI